MALNLIDGTAMTAAQWATALGGTVQRMDGAAFEKLWTELSLAERNDMITGNKSGACWRQNVDLFEKLRRNNLLETEVDGRIELSLLGDRFRDFVAERVEKACCKAHVYAYVDHIFDAHMSGRT